MSTELVVLNEELGFEVDHVQLGIAKHLIYGYTTSDIAEVLGIPEEDILVLIEEEDFKSLRTHLAFQHADQLITVEAGWDGIEAKSLSNLAEVLATNKDPDLNLKAAQIANKASRRTIKGQRAREGQGGTVVQLNLTQRFVTSVQATQEEQPKIIRGTAKGVTQPIRTIVEQIDPIKVNGSGGLESLENTAVPRFADSGKWPDNKPVTRRREGSTSTLVQPTINELNAFLDPKATETATQTFDSVQTPEFTLDA